MRTLDRLISILLTINENSAGRNEAQLLRGAAEILAAGLKAKPKHWKQLRAISTVHPSPHIRELAQETLHYLNRSLNDHPTI